MKKEIKQCIALLILLIGCFIFSQKLGNLAVVNKYSSRDYSQEKQDIEPLSEEETKALFNAMVLKENTDNPILDKLPKECIDYFSLTICDCFGDEHYKKLNQAKKDCVNARSKILYILRNIELKLKY